jgi:hypothetical protein
MKKASHRTHSVQQERHTVEVILKTDDLSPHDLAFCGWVKQITDRTPLPYATRQRIETLLRSVVNERPAFRIGRIASPV